MRKLGITGLFIGCILLLSGCNENAEMSEEESESVKEYVESLSTEESKATAEATEESVEEDAEVDAEAVEEPETWEDQGEEILRRLMIADLSSAEEATITGNWDSVVRLAELPEYDITMYGYNDDEFSGRGVAIQIGEDVNYFDWVYIAPRFILPEMYWDDGKKQLQVALNIYTGTGVGAQELHILQQYETGTLSDNMLDIRTYSELLAERLDYTYNCETKELTIVDKREGSKLFQTTLSFADGEVVEGIWSGEISNFIMGDELWLEFTPGYHLEGRVMTEYEEMVPLKTQIQLESIEENRFVLGKIYNSQLAEFFENPLYQELPKQLDNQGILPDGRLAYGTTNLDGLDPFPNSVAFADVDNDGSEELLVSVGGSCMADMGLYVYQYEEEEQRFREELVAWPGTMFYTNSVAKEPSSHNHGYSCNEDFWPYTLHTYNVEKDEYQRVMRVDAWEKALYPKDYAGNEFPDTLDKDGDGMVYLLYENEEDAPMILDNQEYKAWYREQIGAGKKIDIRYQNTDIFRNI